MAQWCYRGVRTKTVYRFATPLTDSLGNPLVETMYNGEIVIQVNTDFSIRRGTAGPTPPTDPYGPGTSPSEWEQAVPT